MHCALLAKGGDAAFYQVTTRTTENVPLPPKQRICLITTQPSLVINDINKDENVQLSQKDRARRYGIEILSNAA